MKGVEHLDIQEMERLKICSHNLELMQKHITRLENYVKKIDDILNLESMNDTYRIKAIARMTETIKEFV